MEGHRKARCSRQGLVLLIERRPYTKNTRFGPQRGTSRQGLVVSDRTEQNNKYEVAEVRGCTARAYVIRILSCWGVREADTKSHQLADRSAMLGWHAHTLRSRNPVRCETRCIQSKRSIKASSADQSSSRLKLHALSSQHPHLT